jgi:hypothetical protein
MDEKQKQAVEIIAENLKVLEEGGVLALVVVDDGKASGVYGNIGSTKEEIKAKAFTLTAIAIQHLNNATPSPHFIIPIVDTPGWQQRLDKFLKENGPEGAANRASKALGEAEAKINHRLN